MEQLEALQKLYESLSKCPEVLHGIEPDSIVGEQAQNVFWNLYQTRHTEKSSIERL